MTTFKKEKNEKKKLPGYTEARRYETARAPARVPVPQECGLVPLL
jgi:hypothetical protein